MNKISTYTLLSILALTAGGCSKDGAPDHEPPETPYREEFIMSPAEFWCHGASWTEAKVVDYSEAASEAAPPMVTSVLGRPLENAIYHSPITTHYHLTRTIINQVEYLRIFRNGEPTGLYVRLSWEPTVDQDRENVTYWSYKVYGYSTELQEEVMIYDFHPELYSVLIAGFITNEGNVTDRFSEQRYFCSTHDVFSKLVRINRGPFLIQGAEIPEIKAIYAKPFGFIGKDHIVYHMRQQDDESYQEYITLAVELPGGESISLYE